MLRLLTGRITFCLPSRFIELQFFPTNSFGHKQWNICVIKHCIIMLLVVASNTYCSDLISAPPPTTPPPPHLYAMFSCFHNPPNSVMDYRIFNVRTWSFVYVRIYNTHGRLGTRDNESAQHFRLGKSHHFFFLCFGRASCLWISSPTLYQSSRPVTLAYLYIYLQPALTPDQIQT